MDKKIYYRFFGFIVLFITLIICIPVIHGWFVEGDSPRVFITAGTTEIEFELYQVSDHNFDGLYDGDYDLPVFSYIKTPVPRTNDPYIGKFNGSEVVANITKIPESNNYSLTSGINTLTLTYIAPVEVENEFFDIENTNTNFYPSRVVSFAVAIKSPGRNIGAININFENNASFVNTLAEVMSINIGSEKKMFYDHLANDGVVELLDNSIDIGSNEVIWLFFSIEFETLESLNNYYEEQTKFSSLENLNAYQSNGFQLPIIVIKYELHDIIRPDEQDS